MSAQHMFVRMHRLHVSTC